MKKYNVTMIIEIERYGVEAESAEDAISEVRSDMIHEVKEHRLDPDFTVVEVS